MREAQYNALFATIEVKYATILLPLISSLNEHFPHHVTCGRGKQKTENKTLPLKIFSSCLQEWGVCFVFYIGGEDL